MMKQSNGIVSTLPNIFEKYFFKIIRICGIKCFILSKSLYMEQEKVLDPEIDLIEKALDGRSYRWLALEIKMPETELSKRMNGHIKFSKEELVAIHQRLNENLIEKIPIIQE